LDGNVQTLLNAGRPRWVVRKPGARAHRMRVWDLDAGTCQGEYLEGFGEGKRVFSDHSFLRPTVSDSNELVRGEDTLVLRKRENREPLARFCADRYAPLLFPQTDGRSSPPTAERLVSTTPRFGPPEARIPRGRYVGDHASAPSTSASPNGHSFRRSPVERHRSLTPHLKVSRLGCDSNCRGELKGRGIRSRRSRITRWGTESSPAVRSKRQAAPRSDWSEQMGGISQEQFAGAGFAGAELKRTGIISRCSRITRWGTGIFSGR
jgi:hypothetical protein